MTASFDPVSALLGGALIGIAATVLALLIGRVAGVAGIVAETVSPGAVERRWRLAFLAGLIAAPLILAATGHTSGLPAMPGWPQVIAGGLLVGAGTRIAGGCTSGHGICGNARLSPRSFVATLTFMFTAMIVVALLRHGLGVNS